MPRNQNLLFPAIAFFLLLFTATTSNAQDTTQPVELDSVVVKSYGQNTRLRFTAAAENVLNQTTLRRYGSASVVDAVNTTPGVRMEERSPGSYRFNIRGSSLRSPFGVRNVKVYYNDIPLTDPSGQTYLNSLGAYDYGSIEVIKGPGSSFYGAGTGGVLLINSPRVDSTPLLSVEHTSGTWGLQNSFIEATTGTSFQTRVAFQHQESDGYRDQSAMRRNLLNWSGETGIGENGQLKTTFLYSDLYYQTPGGLTLAEFNANNKAARPAAGAFPSAVDARAAIKQQSFVAGVSLTQALTHSIQNKTVAYGSFTKLQNPAIRNYGRNSEPHAGGRTVFTYTKAINSGVIATNIGGEWQQGFATHSVHKNKAGIADTLQTLDDVTNRMAFIFAHLSADIGAWSITGGVSLNQYRLRFHRLFPTPLPEQERSFSNEWAPRVSVLRKFHTFAVYGSIAKGFSPPTTAEAIPTGSAANLDLQAEHGLSTDVGVRGNFFKTLYIDVSAFSFALQNTIVQRRDSASGDYYVNAGSTRQQGIEAYLQQPLLQTRLLHANLWASYTWHRFHYKTFKQLDADYSGNQLPGVAPHTIATGVDFNWTHLTAALSYFFSSRIALNDANSAYARSYHLLAANIGYSIPSQKRVHIAAHVGGNNLLNQKYSLGNDINVAAGRYYNPAPGRNFYMSVSLQWLRKTALAD